MARAAMYERRRWLRRGAVRGRLQKIGLDFGLNLGDKYDKNLALNTSNLQKDESSGKQTRAFTVTK